MFNLSNKIVVITGGAGKLGSKHAEAVAEFGAIPIILDLSQAAVNKIVLSIKTQYGINASGFQVDITNEKQVSECCQEIILLYGKIDVLINNATNNPKVEDAKKDKNFSRLENYDLSKWNQDISVGLTGSFLCASTLVLRFQKILTVEVLLISPLIWELWHLIRNCINKIILLMMSKL